MMRRQVLDWFWDIVVVGALVAIAFGTIWTAYESHVANIGVMQWQREFSQINQPDGPPDNHRTAPPKEPLSGGKTYSE